MTSFKNLFFSLSLIICVNQCLSDYKYQNITTICEEHLLKYTNKTHLGDSSIINGICDSGNHSRDDKLLTIQGKIPVLGENSFSNLTTKLSILNISDVGLEELNPGAFENLKMVDFLDLQNNKIKVIKKGIFDNIAINNILLGNNEISEIEANAFALLDLDWGYGTVDLNSNKLEKIDPEAFNNEYMIELYLINNTIQKVRPGDFKNLPELKYLDLSRNFIKEIPNGVFNGSILSNLKLDNNEISIIENEAFNNMNNLYIFSIRHNKLKQWNSYWFRRSMTQISNSVLRLHISYNKIEEIPEYAFQFMQYYRDNDTNCNIELDGNSIKKISDNAFGGLNKIHLLNLSHNHLEEWKEDWLKYVRIKEIDLTFNKLCQDENSSSIVPHATEVFIEKCKN